MNNDVDSRYLALSGVVEPLLFAGLVIVLGRLEPGYDHGTQMMSVLGGVGGVRGVLFNLGGVLTGLLLIASAAGLHRGIGAGQGARLGPVLVALGGAGLVGSAVFHCNRACTNILRSPTLTGRLHILFSFVTGSCLAKGLLANVPGLILWGSFITTRRSAWEGLIQRLGILFPLLWVKVVAVRLLRAPRPACGGEDRRRTSMCSMRRRGEDGWPLGAAWSDR